MVGVSPFKGRLMDEILDAHSINRERARRLAALSRGATSELSGRAGAHARGK
jgi:NAD(P)-dependent dehydrogenase (short-subunit alcohol dehydrogenase family)